MNVELFSCAGGMGEGFRRAGIEFDWAFDFDPNACESYETNMGTRPIRMDVCDLVRTVEWGWSPGPIDLLVADPPCTPWSRAGNRKGLDDKRDMLRTTCTLIGLLKPRAYLIGNVPGLDDSTNLQTVQEVIGGLSVHGYCVADFMRLDAADYGVPQHRLRTFWFGHLDGPCLVAPAATHCDPRDLATATLPYIAERSPWVTCRAALGHLSLEQLGRPVRQTETRKHPSSRPDEPSMTITTGGSRHQGNTLSLPARKPKINHRLTRPNEPAKVITCNTHSDGAYLEWPWDRPATTVQSDPRLAPPGHHTGSDRSDPNAIALSEMAAAVIQGFPESWAFTGATKKARWAQIGMAMPPPLAHAVATSIREQLERTKHDDKESTED